MKLCWLRGERKQNEWKHQHGTVCVGRNLKDLPFRWYLGNENGAGLQKSKLEPLVLCWQAVLCKNKIPIKPAFPAAGNLHIQFLTQVPLLFLTAPAPLVCALWEIFTASTQNFSSPQHMLDCSFVYCNGSFFNCFVFRNSAFSYLKRCLK